VRFLRRVKNSKLPAPGKLQTKFQLKNYGARTTKHPLELIKPRTFEGRRPAPEARDSKIAKSSSVDPVSARLAKPLLSLSWEIEPTVRAQVRGPSMSIVGKKTS